MQKGTFIVFEGGEGSGKTRHSGVVVEKLRSEGYDVVHTHEPGDSSIGSAIRAIIFGQGTEALSHRAELFLFLADRAQHIDTVIRPAIEAGKVVVCDRFSGSTFAYQVGGRSLENESFIKQMDAYARNDIEPDTVLYLDIDPQEGLARKKEAQQELNSMDNEELEFHQRVREYFLKLVERDPHWQRIDTSGPKEKNERTIYTEIKKHVS